MKKIQTLLMAMLSIAFAANAQTVRVPDVKEFKTTEECNRYTSTANACAEYYLTHTLDEPMCRRPEISSICGRTAPTN